MWWEQWVSSQRGLNLKLLCRADLRSAGPYHAGRCPRCQSVCNTIKMQLTNELSELAVTEVNVVCTSMAPGLTEVNYSAWALSLRSFHVS